MASKFADAPQVLHNRILRHDEKDQRFVPQVNHYLGADGQWVGVHPQESHSIYHGHLARVLQHTDYSWIGHVPDDVEVVSFRKPQEDFRLRQTELCVHYNMARAKGQVRWLQVYPQPA
jgi:hypothetical protein